MAGGGSGDCVVALTEGASPVPGAIAISDSAASLPHGQTSHHHGWLYPLVGPIQDWTGGGR